MLLSNDASWQNYFVTYYNASYKFQFRPGWNLINLRTSDWKGSVGSPTWANPIIRVRFRFYGTSAASYSIDGLTSGAVAQPAVIFTFDKGLSSLYDQAFSFMQTHNVRGTGYIVTNWANPPGDSSWAQLLEITQVGLSEIKQQTLPICILPIRGSDSITLRSSKCTSCK